MMKQNHLLAAATAVAAMDGLAHWPVTVLGMAVALPAGLLSDLDTASSAFGRKAGPIPYLIHRLGIRHRTLFHSLTFAAWFAAGLLALGTSLHWPWTRVVALSAFAGLMAHPFADAFTESGVSILWPVPLRLRLGHLKVNSALENGPIRLGLMALSVAVIGFVGAHYGWGVW